MVWFENNGIKIGINIINKSQYSHRFACLSKKGSFTNQSVQIKPGTNQRIGLELFPRNSINRSVLRKLILDQRIKTEIDYKAVLEFFNYFSKEQIEELLSFSDDLLTKEEYNTLQLLREMV